MKVEVKLIADKVDTVKVNDKRIETFTDIIDEYCNEKGYGIYWDGDVYNLSKKDTNVEIFLVDYTNYALNDEKNSVVDYNEDDFKKILSNLIDEVKNAMKELNKEKIIVIEIQ